MQSGYPDYEPLINPSFYITKLPSSFKALMVEIYNQEEVYQLDCSHINFLYCYNSTFCYNMGKKSVCCNKNIKKIKARTSQIANKLE